MNSEAGKRLKLRSEISKIETQIDGLLLSQEAIAVQLDTSCRILETKRFELSLIEGTPYQIKTVNFIGIEKL